MNKLLKIQHHVLSLSNTLLTVKVTLRPQSDRKLVISSASNVETSDALETCGDLNLEIRTVQAHEGREKKTIKHADIHTGIASLWTIRFSALQSCSHVHSTL